MSWFPLIGAGLKVLFGVMLVAGSLQASDPLIGLVGGSLSAMPLAALIAKRVVTGL